jgi:hypothetical protein
MNKIDTTKDFTKHVGSLKAAMNLFSSLNTIDGRVFWTTRKYGNLIDSAFGKIEGLANASYNPTYKTLTVEYIDGREKPEEKKPKETYYVVWIEGLSAQKGEKILSLDSDNHEYTTSMTQAMRVKKEHIPVVKHRLKEQGVADWALSMSGTFHPVHYAPKGTIFQP